MDMDRYKPGLGKNQGLVQQLREFQRNPRSLVFVSLAESYRLEGLPHQALEILDEGLGHHPGLASAVVAKARCLFDLKRYAEALTETQLAIRNNPQNLKAHKLQAEIYVRLGQRKAAIRSLTQVVTLYPQDQEAVRSLEELEDLENKKEMPAPTVGRASVDTPPTLGRIEDFQVGSVAESIAQLKDGNESGDRAKAAKVMEGSAEKISGPEAPAGASAGGATPVINTRAIAELFLSQGLSDQASQILRELARDPANEWARETLQDLSSDGIVLPTQPSESKRSESLKKKARALERMLAAVRLMKPVGP
jgi:tetratricopeptide (TPR) repeat protein